MADIEWMLVVTGWTIIFMALSISHFKMFRVGGGICKLEDKRIRNERWVIRLLFSVYLIAAAFIAKNVHITAFDKYTGIEKYHFIFLGIIIFIIAICVFISGRVALGSNWSWSGKLLRDRRKLIKSGPYSCVRHPLYSSYVVAGIASGLILTDSRILIFIVLILPAVYLKAKIEEQFLRMIFPDYEDYKKQTRMFF
jgi:protein-S-isoprenylcysteine O-methyltransferase Ste14